MYYNYNYDNIDEEDRELYAELCERRRRRMLRRRAEHWKITVERAAISVIPILAIAWIAATLAELIT